MKKFFASLILQMATLISSANHQSTTLNLKVFGNAEFTVQVDNNFYNVPDRFYAIHELIPGRHYVRVVRFSQQRHFGFRPRVLRQEVFSGYVMIPASRTVDANISFPGSFDIIHIVPTEFCSNETIDPFYNSDVNCETGYIQPTCEINPVMSDNDFEQLKHTLTMQSFESTRMEIVKQVIPMNKLNTNQVSQLMRLFDFDSSRLELAKFAYQFTFDKQNYYLTYNNLDFDSSVRELSEYIQSRA